MDSDSLRFEEGLGSHLQFLKPFVLPDLIRIGNEFDGGYLVPRSALERTDALISFGVGNDWSVEEAVHRLRPTIPIHSYDHMVGAPVLVRQRRYALQALLKAGAQFLVGWASIASLRTKYSRYQRVRELCSSYQLFFRESRIHYRERVFNRKELSGYVTMDDVLARLPSARSIFLKMDIEGGEYRIIGDILKHAERMVLLVIEFHETEPYRSVFVDRVLDICKRFRIVHVHGNNFSGVAPDGLPETLEITFVNRQLVQSDVRRTRLPLEGLDFPNDPTRAELSIQWGQ